MQVNMYLDDYLIAFCWSSLIITYSKLSAGKVGQMFMLGFLIIS